MNSLAFDNFFVPFCCKRNGNVALGTITTGYMDSRPTVFWGALSQSLDQSGEDGHMWLAHRLTQVPL